MKNYIIEYFINGKLDQILTCVSAECKPLLDAAVNAEEAVNSILTDKQKAVFRVYCDVALDFKCQQLDHHFTEGFKAGMLMGLQIRE